ncbi:MAG: GH92 family glycosyl hydrolase [Bacteroidales bacterium]|nr:GH92 family glycosyl hydrolase [Candidatus Latescibacterota bacterium]
MRSSQRTISATKWLLIIFCIAYSALSGPGSSLAAEAAKAAEELCTYVNPFIGTRDMGHTFPGATMPFGMVQLSPDTDTLMFTYGDGYNPDVYRYCAGYQYDDPTIVGFSHTHFNGTGHSDLGDFLLMPAVGPIRLNPGTAGDPDFGYRSRYSKTTEKASPGHYAVTLADYEIDVELTATERVGFHKYSFTGKESDAHIILDLVHGIYNYDGKVIWSSIRVENDTLVTGMRQTRGWARTRSLFFAMVFSKPISSYGLHNEEDIVYNGWWRKFDENEDFPERAGRNIKAHFDFDIEEGDEILVKFALSPVSAAGALKNLRAEVPHMDFDRTRGEARAAWERQLSKITIDASPDRKINFYTALYHACMSPVVFCDVDGSYRGLDQEIHRDPGFTNYSIFSLWDTYRALHPLLTIIEPQRSSDMIRSMLAHSDESVHGILPVWSHHSDENWCMIGYHAVPVIVDAWMKGIRGFDGERALASCVRSANFGAYDGIAAYKSLGYVPEDVSGSSASKTLEYAYDDWCISQLAGELGREDLAKEFQERSANYKNIFDKSTGFMRARNSDGAWLRPFDALSVAGQGYIEGNAWNYSLYVPHDVPGLIDLVGGNDRLVEWLDSLFVMSVSDEDIAHSEDVTRVGMIGNYVHGNEPSHHIAYLYSYAGAPEKTARRVRQIVDTMYRAAPDGLCGNDDCGQMSAWYIFSCLGFYPVCPGSNEYLIGVPCVEEAIIRPAGGPEIRIVTEEYNSGVQSVRSVKLDGKLLGGPFLDHSRLMNCSKLEFMLGGK